VADLKIPSGLLPQPILGQLPEGLVRRGSAKKAVAKPSTQERIDRALVSGVGGMGFRSLAPPGSGRLVRIPFYPLVDSQSWTGVNGIDSPGDDPILNLTIPVGSSRSDRLTMQTYQFDYGAYKVLGLQTNFQGSYDTGIETTPQGGPQAVSPGSSPNGVAISVGTLSLYNGQTLFVQFEDMDASTFQLLPDFQSSLIELAGPAFGSQRENPTNYLARRSRFFPGLRDLPVVSGTASVTLQVSAFIGNQNPLLLPVEIPFSCYLVADLVEDYVFGDPINPSPSSRAGANVKLGAKDLGVSAAGRHQYDLTSARHKRKS